MGHACTTNLLEFMDLVKKAVDGKLVDIVYIDFAKVFDVVPRKQLVKKIKQRDWNLE